MSMRRTSGSPQAVQTDAQLTKTPTPLHVASPMATASRPLLKEAGTLDHRIKPKRPCVETRGLPH